MKVETARDGGLSIPMVGIDKLKLTTKYGVFIICERGGELSITCEGQMVIAPRSANLVYLKEGEF